MKEKSVIFFDIYYPAFYILSVGRIQHQIPFSCFGNSVLIQIERTSLCSPAFCNVPYILQCDALPVFRATSRLQNYTRFAALHQNTNAGYTLLHYKHEDLLDRFVSVERSNIFGEFMDTHIYCFVNGSLGFDYIPRTWIQSASST